MADEVMWTLFGATLWLLVLTIWLWLSLQRERKP